MNFMSYIHDINVKVLIGLTVSGITKTNDEIAFEDKNGRTFRLYHDQDCCESVSIESIRGNIDDLVGSPIQDVKEEITSEFPADIKKPEYIESDTFTTFTFTTLKGVVVIRWWGSSNGYYSESVSFQEVARQQRSEQGKGR